ncbi:MAG: RNA recognition motif domain-containing protein [Nitrospiraceae bacterium]
MMVPRATDAMPTRFYVKDLPPSFRDEHLRTLVAPFGTVIRASVITTMSGESLPLAYVEMSQPEDAANAVQRLHQTLIEGHVVVVGYL